MDMLTQIDKALGRYYERQGDKSYYDEKNEGKFKKFCIESSLESEELANELEEDPLDCMLTDFDKDDDVYNFPIKQKFDDEDAKTIAIFNIIKKCMEDPNAYMAIQPLEVTDKDFDISDEKIDADHAAIKFHIDQCPTIFANDQELLNDQIFLKLIAISHKKKKPYIIYLADMYQRARVDNIDNDGYKIDEWARKNKHMKELKATNSANCEAVVGAIASFQHRVCPALMLSPTNVIVDSLADTCLQIGDTIEFVAKLAADKNTTCPFQFDAIFAFNKVKEVGTSVGASTKDTEKKEDDDEDDDDDDDDNNQSGDVEKGPFYDVFGDVKKKLESAKLLHRAFPINDDRKQDDDDDEKDDKDKRFRSKRVFMQGFNEFRSDIQKKYGNDGLEEYPRKHRFNAFMDRRQPDEEDNKDKNILEDNELIFFEPPENAKELPQGRITPMFYFNSSRTVLIPPSTNDDEKEKDLGQKGKELAAEINSLSSCKGALMLLSFHVESSDEIRCYMSMNGQIIRFLPSDIINLLPRFFDMELKDQVNGDNAIWKTTDEANRLVKEMEKNLVDIHFTSFLKEYQPESISQQKDE